jgi:hypothetical protein
MSIFAAVISIMMLLIEIRTISVSNKLLNLSVQLEKELGYSAMSEFKEFTETEGIPQRHITRALYIWIAVMWLAVMFFAPPLT